MKPFIYQSRAQRVVFGAGSLTRLPQELEALGLRRVLLLSTQDQREHAMQIASSLGADAIAGHFDRAIMHVPMPTVAEAIAQARAVGADATLAIGGGSTIGLGKALALHAQLPLVAVPTTYAGSEMTPIWGITENGLKTTGRDERVLPRTVVYDPSLSHDLPLALTVTSGINAIAHAAEGLYAVDGNPVMDLMAREGIRAMASAIAALAGNGGAVGTTARSDALYGAWLCGTVLGTVGMALHHKLCHTLGGSFNLPHAQVHTVVLPHALAYNAGAAPQAMAHIAAALGAADAAQGVFDLARDHGAPTSLQQLGLQEQDIERACDIALQTPYPNPRPLERAPLLHLLRNAHAGIRPASATGNP